MAAVKPRARAPARRPSGSRQSHGRPDAEEHWLIAASFSGRRPEPTSACMAPGVTATAEASTIGRPFHTRGGTCRPGRTPRYAKRSTPRRPPGEEEADGSCRGRATAEEALGVVWRDAGRADHRSRCRTRLRGGIPASGPGPPIRARCRRRGHREQPQKNAQSQAHRAEMVEDATQFHRTGSVMAARRVARPRHGALADPVHDALPKSGVWLPCHGGRITLRHASRPISSADPSRDTPCEIEPSLHAPCPHRLRHALKAS